MIFQRVYRGAFSANLHRAEVTREVLKPRPRGQLKETGGDQDVQVHGHAGVLLFAENELLPGGKNLLNQVKKTWKVTLKAVFGRGDDDFELIAAERINRYV